MKRVHGVFLTTTLLLSLIVTLGAADAFARASANGRGSREMFAKGMVNIRLEDNVEVSRFQRGFGMVSTGLGSLDNVLNSFKANNLRPIFENAVRIRRTPDL